MFLLSFLFFGVTDKGSTCEGIRHLIPPGFENWRNGLDFYLGSLSIFIFGSFTPREVLGNACLQPMISQTQCTIATASHSKR